MSDESDEQWKFKRLLEILLEVDKRSLTELLEKRTKKSVIIENQIEECDKKIFRRCNQRSTKIYNMTQSAKVLGVHRETLYYWIKKGWIKPSRDYRGYPVFTVLDLEKLIKWKNTIK